MNVNRHIVRVGMPLVAALAMYAPQAHGQFAFAAGVNYPVGDQPSGAAAADFNADGLPDLAVTADLAGGQDRLAILLGTGGGAFAAPFYVVLPNSSSPEAVVAGDLDGDGDTDVAVGLKDNAQVIAVLNGGAANFTLGATAPTGLEPRGMDIADVDGDEDLDLIVANRSSNTATLLVNSGSATFAATTLQSGAEPRDAAFGDFDNDSDPDISVSCHDDRTVRVYANNGGAFTPTATLSVGNNDRPEGIDTGDVNGDGRADIAAASGDDAATGQNRVVLFTSNSASSFAGPIYVPAGAVLETSDVAVTDLDCDGDLDLATVNRITNNVSVIANGGTGTFGPASILTAGAAPDVIVAAELDTDGDSDLLAVNRNSDDVTVLINTTCVPVLTADVDGDSDVDIDDLFSILGAWGPCLKCPQDITGDGVVDVDDLFEVIGQWQP